MSKSRGNTVDPDDLVARYGADTVRLFLMFMGPWDQGGPWSPTGIGGVHRFLNRVWTLAIDEHGREPGDPDSGSLPAGESEADAQAAIRAAAHRTLRDVTADYEAFHFNTMIAKLMELSNTLFRYRGTVVAGTPAWDEAIRLLLLMLAPAAPHITEELWSRRLEAAGQPWVSIHAQTWPEVDPTAVVESTREIPVQVNGKLRDKVVVPADASAGRHRGGRPGPRQDQGDPRRARPGPHRRGRRREARQPRRPVTSDDALAFDRHLDATAPAVADIARALRLTVLEGFPGAVETFDPADGLLAIGTGRSMRDFSFAIIPHKAHVNLQLADGVDLPNPDGQIEGTGKRVRHVKVRSVEDARATVGPGRDRGTARLSRSGAERRAGPAAASRRIPGLEVPPCPTSSLAPCAGTSTPTGRACSPPDSGRIGSATTRSGRGITSTRSRAARADRCSRPG